MPSHAITSNTLFYGDNLEILREYIADESIDLVYLDPPFNSNRNYNVLFRDEAGKDSESQITAFEDTWHWGPDAEHTYHGLVTAAPVHIGQMIGAMRQFVGANQMMAYLVMMAARLVELHRTLKPTGSLYLHCDPTASHYLKIILDTIFRPQNYRNEIIWKRTFAHGDAQNYGNLVDSIFYYAKSARFTWNKLYTLHSAEYLARFSHIDSDGRRWMDTSLSGKGLSGGGYEYEYRGVRTLWRCPEETMRRLEAEDRLYITKTGGIRLKRYLDENKGLPLQALWDDISPINSQSAERLGYPTQKPLALLERIIAASSNAGDLVLDPFCGCGTAIAAAQKLGRKWIGIDITHLSIALQKYRLEEMYPGIKFEVIGQPEDIGAATQLAHDDRYSFQWWALCLVRAMPLGGQAGSKMGKKGADKGIDGVITFIDDATHKPKRILIQVKSGHVKSGDIRDLRGTVEREDAVIGVFITLEPPSKDMTTEAITGGYYQQPGWDKPYPKIQILTIAELLKGAVIQMPSTNTSQPTTFKQAARVTQADGEQSGFNL